METRVGRDDVGALTVLRWASCSSYLLCPFSMIVILRFVIIWRSTTSQSGWMERSCRDVLVISIRRVMDLLVAL